MRPSKNPGLASLFLLVLLTLAPIAAAAQSFNVQGGYSNLFNAQGGKITFRDEQYEGWLGAGSLQARFRIGGYVQTQLRSFTVGAGDAATEFNLPTDLFTGGQYLLVRGFSVKHTISEKTYINVFGGMSSFGFSAPYMQTAEADTPIGMIFIDHEFTSKVRFFSHNMFSGRQTTINGLRYKPLTWLSTALAAGIGSNQAYFSSSLQVDRRVVEIKAGFAASGEHFRRVAVPSPASSEIDGANIRVVVRPSSDVRLTIGHQNYLETVELNRSTRKATTNELGTDLSALEFRLGASLYQTTFGGVRGTGMSVTVGRKVTRWFDASGNYVRSQAQGSRTETMVTGIFREKLHPRVNFSQFITRNNGQTVVSWGGEFISNRLHVNVDYQNVYVPFNVGKPFTQALMINATTRVFGAFQMQLGTFVDASGRLRYTVSASDFLYRSRGGDFREGTRQASLRLPKFLVRGRVVDEQSNPVCGAAVYVNRELAYTGADGRFFVRVTRRSVAEFRVATDEFTVPGYWMVLNAPGLASPQPESQAIELHIVVKRVTPTDARAQQLWDYRRVASGELAVMDSWFPVILSPTSYDQEGLGDVQPV